MDFFYSTAKRGLTGLLFAFLSLTLSLQPLNAQTEAEHQCAIMHSGEGLPKAPFAKSSGTFSILYVRVMFAGETLTPVQTDMQQVYDYYTDNSYGAIDLTTTTPPIVYLPLPRTSYSSSSWQGAANLQLINAGFNTAAYDILIYRMHPGNPILGFTGGAYYGTHIRLTTSDAAICAHEIGHGLYNYFHPTLSTTLGHANYWDCSNSAATIGPGNQIEYGNRFDRMGSGAIIHHLSAAIKNQIGWLTDNEIHRIRTNGTYRIYTHDQGSKTAGRKYGAYVDLKARPMGTTFDRDRYWFEFKTKPYSTENSIILHLNQGGSYSNGALLLDNSPGSISGTNDANDADLALNETFTDEEFGISITPVAASGTGANRYIDVEVTFTHAPGSQAESTPGITITSPANNATLAQGTNVTLQTSTTGYAKRVVLSKLVNGIYQQVEDNLYPPYTFSLGSLPAGTHTYRVQPSNDYVSGVAQTVTFTVSGSGTSTPPGQPTNLQASLSGTDICVLSWQDNSSVESGYRVERKIGNGNFVQIAQLGQNATSYTNGALQPATTYTYRVYAYNTNGNSSYSNTASVTTPEPVVNDLENFVGEVGKVNVSMANGDQWHTVNLQRSYTEAVVVLGPPSFQNGEPVTTRVRNVTSNSFQFQIKEWEYLDGAHPAEWMSYLVLEAGNHVIGGTVWEAGRVDGVEDQIDGFTTVNWQSSLVTKKSVVFSTVGTHNGDDAVTSRVHAVKAGNFKLTLQEEQGAADGGNHVGETVHYIAVRLRGNTMTSNNIDFRVRRTAKIINHNWSTVGINTNLGGAPHLIAGIQNRAGTDAATLRYRNLTGSDVEVMIQEETSADAETTHPNSKIGYIIFNDDGLLAADANSESLFNSYEELATEEALEAPKVVAYPNPTNGLVMLRNHAGPWEVYSITGVLALRGSGTECDLSELPPGLYLWRGSNETLRIVKR